MPIAKPVSPEDYLERAQTFYRRWSSMLSGILVFPLLAAAYAVPALVAFLRKHPQRVSIFLVNVALGWTVIGWLVALAWSIKTSPASSA